MSTALRGRSLNLTKMISPDELYLEPESSSFKPLMWNGVMLVGALFLGYQVVNGGSLLRIVAAAALITVFAIPAINQPKRAMFMLFCWLPFLGIVRRVLVPATGFSRLDPLLLVSSAVVILIFVTLLVTKRANINGTWLTRLVFYLLIIGLLQVFNPSQGNGIGNTIVVGLTGVMFLLVPMICFFIGRSVADEKLIQKMHHWIIAVGIITAGYGAYQVYVGFPGFEKAYLAKAGFGALYVGGAIRPFSTFTNPLEYSAYLDFAVMATLAYLLYRKGIGRYWLWGALAFMVWSGYNIGSRGFVVYAIIGAMVLIGSRARNAVLSAGLIVAMMGGLVYYAVNAKGTATQVSATASAAQQLQARNQAGLSNPLDPNQSTLRQHFTGVKDGLIFAINNAPFGLGTGSTGRGSTKFGGLGSNSTELDISDAAVAFGLVGGAIYMAIVLITGIQLYRMRKMVPGPMIPTILGMAIVSFGQWLNGGNYAVAPLIWFMIGAADAVYYKIKSQPKEVAADIVPA
ncbi:MAG: hypothetical protein ACYDCC_02110 [Actinomycetota bacterium]